MQVIMLPAREKALYHGWHKHKFDASFVQLLSHVKFIDDAHIDNTCVRVTLMKFYQIAPLEEQLAYYSHGTTVCIHSYEQSFCEEKNSDATLALHRSFS